MGTLLRTYTVWRPGTWAIVKQVREVSNEHSKDQFVTDSQCITVEFSHHKISTYPSHQPNLKSNRISESHLRNLQETSWNMGGMPSDRYPLTLFAFTRRRIGSLPTHDQYHAVHSGDTTNHAGLLTLISKKLIKDESLTWTERVPGRLVQLKLRGRTQELDLLHCYQHVYKPSKMADRTSLWTELHNTVAGLPSRNRCCILGDFNTTKPVANAKVGHKDFLHHGVRHVGPSHKDWKSLHTLLEQFDFNALNSWTDLGPTNMHEGRRCIQNWIYLVSQPACRSEIKASEVPSPSSHASELAL